MRRSVIGHDWLSFFGGDFFLGGGGESTLMVIIGIG